MSQQLHTRQYQIYTVPYCTVLYLAVHCAGVTLASVEVGPCVTAVTIPGTVPFLPNRVPFPQRSPPDLASGTNRKPVNTSPVSPLVSNFLSSIASFSPSPLFFLPFFFSLLFIFSCFFFGRGFPALPVIYSRLIDLSFSDLALCQFTFILCLLHSADALRRVGFLPSFQA